MSITRARINWALYLVVTVFATALIALGWDRPYFGYGVETDYVSRFVIDAQRFVAGQPMDNTYHPPLYSMVVGLTGAIVGDWHVAALIVAGVSGVGSVLCGYALFRIIGGEAAAWGAVLGLMTSTPFITMSSKASTDTLFLFMFLAASLLAVKAMVAGSQRLWLGCGLVAGLALMTRSNGVTLALLLLVPLLVPPRSERSRGFLHALAGFAIPIVVMLTYGLVSGSQIFPSGGTRDNLAASYFGDFSSGSLGDAVEEVQGRFDTVLDVILHDPLHIAVRYATDLYLIARSGLTRLMQPPWFYLFLPGLMLLLIERRDRALWAVIGLVAVHLLLTNLKQPFEARNYLFLVPLMGAGVGILLAGLGRAVREPSTRGRLGALVVAAAVFTSGAAHAEAHARIQGFISELRDVMPAIRSVVEENATIFTTKPHIPYYFEARRGRLPTGIDLASLPAALQSRAAEGPVHLFLGELERSRRAGLEALWTVDEAPPWLEPVARGGADRWILYRYRTPEAPR